MAPNKKKKKPSSNPARGFATTSIASKPRSNDLDTTSEAEGSIASLIFKKSSIDPSRENEPPETSTELNQLSPDEFEKQLEEAELQDLIDKHGSKSRREAARQVVRLQTERRVLRGQTEQLNLRQWLPPEAVEQIIDLRRCEGEYTVFKTDSEHLTKTGSSSEGESCVRLWTLQQALLGLDIPKDKVQQVLQSLLEEPLTQNVIPKGVGKDIIWGLDESLDWLALNCDREELPSYDGRSNRTRAKKEKESDSLSIRSRAGEAQSCPGWPTRAVPAS